MPSTFAKTQLAEWREPSGFIVFHDESPDGSRRSATQGNGNGLATAYFHPRDAFLIFQDLLPSRNSFSPKGLKFFAFSRSDLAGFLVKCAYCHPKNRATCAPWHSLWN